MQEDWTSSLSIATSIDTESSRQRNAFDATSEREISTPQASSFPTPPPRHFVPQEARLSDSNWLGLGADHHCSITSRPKYLSLDRNHTNPSNQHPNEQEVGANTWTRDLQQSHSEVDGVGSAEGSVSEPLEQLGQFNSRSSSPQALEDEYAALPQRLVPATRPLSYTKATFQRPRIESGLPTSYSHALHRPRSASTSSLAPSLASVHRVLQTYGTASPHLSPPPRSAPSGQLGAAEASQSSSPVLVPSPALHFKGLKDQPWSRYISDSIGSLSRPSSAASVYGPSQTSSVEGASASDFGHSRGPSLATTVQTHPTSVAGSCHPSRPPSVSGIENTPSSIAQDQNMRFRGRRDVHDRVRFDTTSHNQPSLDHGTSRSRPILLAPPPPRMPPEYRRQAAHNNGRQEQDSASGGRFPSVTTELVYGSHYLEPYNSCEAIMLPRPRLRSRSLGSTPAIVVEKVYAAPERFWQRNVEANEGDRLQVVPRSTVNSSTNGRSSRMQTQSEHTQPRRSPVKDARLVVHESMPPPVPPKDAPLPSSGLLPVKPLPPIPTPPMPTPAASPESNASRTSEDSVEYLDAPELLQRNRELEEERQAWREEYRNSLGANAVPLRDRLSPCLKHPSIDTKGRRRVEAPSSDDTHDAYPSPIRVHRVWNEDGTEQTFLVVQSKRRHTYSNQAMSISTPDLRLGSIVQRPHLVQSLAARFSSLTGRSRGSSAGAEAFKSGGRLLPASRDTTAPSTEAKTPPHTRVDTVRSFGRERKLVSDETVIIGKSPEPGHREDSIGQAKLGALRANEPLEVQVMTGPNVDTSHRLPLTGYKPASTLDELKAQLGDHPHLVARQQIPPHFHASRNFCELRDHRAWFDLGFNTIMQGEPLPASLLRIGEKLERDSHDRGGAHKQAASQENDGQPHPHFETGCIIPPSDLSSGVSVSRSDSDSSHYSGRLQSWQTAQPSHDSTASGGCTVRASAELVESSDNTTAGPSTAEAATTRGVRTQTPVIRHVDSSNTGDSTISSDAHFQPTLWDASTVSIDNLFFRPPPSRLP